MIRKLRYKFLIVTIGCIGLLFALILAVINLSMSLSARAQGYALLDRLSQDIPPYRSQETFPFNRRPPDSYQDALRVFSVTYDGNGAVTSIDYNERAGLAESVITQMGESARNSYQKSGKEKGSLSAYLYLVKALPDGQRIFFLDSTLERSFSVRLFNLCLIAGLCGMGILSVAAFFLSGWMVKPVQNAFDKQKQFIADASHELKTPLTIITTNAEVLSGSLVDSRWLGNILDQARRMNFLIRDLLELARMDSFEKNVLSVSFDLSAAVSGAALSFESLAYESRKTYRLDVAECLTCKGDEGQIRQLVTILLDNAFKYANDRGTITLQLTARNEKKILSVTNTGNGIPQKDQAHIFERFYRCDDSRSRDSGGYGLGLSIAASIVKAHRGHISVKSDEKSYTCITVTFP